MKDNNIIFEINRFYYKLIEDKNTMYTGGYNASYADFINILSWVKKGEGGGEEELMNFEISLWIE